MRARGDYAAFERVLVEAREREARCLRICPYVLMPNGARFKSFPLKEDRHFLKVCRYVERNPLRVNLVKRAEPWPWCSLHKRLAACGVAEPSAATPTRGEATPDGAARPGAAELLDKWPVREPPA